MTLIEPQLPAYRLWQMARDRKDADAYFDVLMVAHGHAPLSGQCIVGGMNWPVCALGVQLHKDCRADRIRKLAKALDGGQEEGGSE